VSVTVLIERCPWAVTCHVPAEGNVTITVTLPAYIVFPFGPVTDALTISPSVKPSIVAATC
jgi:hypothetical protein